MLYAVSLWLQTLAGLLGLALIGGWALAPFRRDERPWLWLVAPVAGVAVFSLLMTLLCRFGGASVKQGLTVTLATTIPLTAIVFWRRVRASGVRRFDWLTGLLVAIVAGWATFTCNRASISTGEPALFARDGSDMVGYAQMADWFLRHPGEAPQWNPEYPEQAFTSILHRADPRWGTFLLLSTAAKLRNTTALMSYDLVCGLVFAVGLLGLAGAYASRRLGMVLLLVAGGLSLWFAVGRSGYLGKLTAYPGYLCLCALYLQTLVQPTRWRLAALSVLGTGLGFCHTLSALACVMGLVAGPATLFAMGRSWQGPQLTRGRRVRERVLALGRSVAAYLAITAPLVCTYFAMKLSVGAGGPKSIAWSWQRVIGVSLEIEPLSVNLSPAIPASALLWIAALVQGLLLLEAWRQRSLEAGALLGVVWFMGATAGLRSNWHLYQIQGIFFPLSLAAAVMLWESRSTTRHAGWSRRLLLLTMLAALAVRWPQAQHAWDRYVASAATPEFRFTESELRQILAATDDAAVRVVTTQIHSGLVLMAELAARDRTAQYSRAAWQTLFRYTRWPTPDYPAPEVLIGGREQRVPPAAILTETERYRIVSTAQEVLLFPAEVPHGIEHDSGREEIFWQGKQPSRWEALNFTGAPKTGVLSAKVTRGPDYPYDRQLTLHVAASGVESAQHLPVEPEWTLHVPVVFPVGRHEVTFWPDGGDVMTREGGDRRDRILMVKAMSLEPVPTGPSLIVQTCNVPHRLEHDAEGHDIFWQGRAPTLLEVLNYADRPQEVAITALTRRGPNHPDQVWGELEVLYDGVRTSHEVRHIDGWRLRSLLTLPPGRQQVALWTDTPPVWPAEVRDPRDRLFLVEQVAVEPAIALAELSWEFRDVPHGLEKDPHQQPMFWQGGHPSTLVFRNPSRSTLDVTFTAEAPRGPNHPERDHGTIRVEWDARSSTHTVRASDRWRLQLALSIPPGQHELRLSATEPAGPPAYGSDPRDRMFLVRNIEVSAPERPLILASHPTPVTH